jgi:prepilin-type N-terminal cleavage/methylation domain-containing protein
MHIGPCQQSRSRSGGFTLVEIAVTLLLLGMLFALAAPTVTQLSGSYTLKTATENLAGQIRLGRERAIATGANQHFHFTTVTNADYFIIDHGTAVTTGNWRFPKGVQYFNGAGTMTWIDMSPDGRAKWGTSPASGFIILQDRRGVRDTVSIQASGLVLTQ